VAGCLAILGAMVAAALTLGWGGRRVRRCLLIATAAASVVLLVRGLLGLTLLGVSLLGGTFDERTPAILLAIEPWFLLGGLAYGGLTLHQRPCMNTPSNLTVLGGRPAPVWQEVEAASTGGVRSVSHSGPLKGTGVK
jgi:hypothetical protein